MKSKLGFFVAGVTLLIATLLLGCETGRAHRAVVSHPLTQSDCPGPANSSVDIITPETHAGYVLHHLEFDDQGWPYPDGSDDGKVLNPAMQIDCAIADLKRRLSEGVKVRAFVFVHGWHHSAKNDDRNLRDFRNFLAAQAKSGPRREVIGYYISWRGETNSIRYVRDLTFWGRKNAAHHVAEGSVREFFARMKAIRNAVNRKKAAQDCGFPETAERGDDVCPLRTVMIGHSFGAWILYASTAPYIMETLTGKRDLPKIGRYAPKLPRTHRERGIADLIILLNPAFEASRYEPVHRAAKNYRPDQYEPPLLISVTSRADDATGIAFPVARFFNSILQHPASSELGSEAMKRTHGHMTHYLTHDLTCTYLGDKPDATNSCPKREEDCKEKDGLMRDAFFKDQRVNGTVMLKSGWARQMCGAITLTHRNVASALPPDSIVWNVQTDTPIISDHNDISGESLQDFIRQIYGDLRHAREIQRAPRTTSEVDDDEDG